MSAPRIINPATAGGGVPVGGSGADGYVAKWTAATTLGGSTTTGATASLYVDATGKVGIGTASPAGFLQISNPANDGATHIFLSIGSNRQASIRADTSSIAGLVFATGDSSVLVDRMYIDRTTGNVGIGTTSPAKKLDVNGAANVTGALTVAGSVSRTSGSTAGVANLAYIVVAVPETYKALLLSSTTTSNETLSSLHLIGSDVVNCNVTVISVFQTTVANNGSAASVRITNTSGGTATIKWSFLQIS